MPALRPNAPTGLPPGAALLFAVAAGASVANVYFAQPLLATLGADFGIGERAVGAVVTLTQLGYGIGLLLLVPLGDRLDRKRLAVAQMLALAFALTAVATARSPGVLFAAFAAVGLLAVVTQLLVASAAALADDTSRGRVVGTVTAGIVVGILLARTVAGLLADAAGWRSVYAASAVLSVAVAAALARILPSGGARPTPPPYRKLLGSLPELLRTEPLFRQRAVIALLLFASFGTLWSSVALPLSEPPYTLSHSAIGAFGLAGAAGALAASPAGRLADRGYARHVTGGGLALLTLSWLPLAATTSTLWALAAGAIVLDLAVQAVHVTNQTVLYALRPDAGSSLIGGYMVFYSLGSALGAITATTLYAAAGWHAVCALGASFALAGLGVWALGERGARRARSSAAATASGGQDIRTSTPELRKRSTQSANHEASASAACRAATSE
ncbi:MFS transporter [Yinghuangia aomiensis]|uniref:MFS transporter n=1 Tax=Yinghuangia aomiensis TaxID=676205 RepID=A0ABP9GYV2_9ACTN